MRALLADPVRTRFVAVTRPAALPRAETVRLLKRLRAASIAVPVVIVNAAGAGTCSRCRAERSRQSQEIAALAREIPAARQASPWLIQAPATVPPPVGWRDLHHFFSLWRETTLPARR